LFHSGNFPYGMGFKWSGVGLKTKLALACKLVWWWYNQCFAITCGTINTLKNLQNYGKVKTLLKLDVYGPNFHSANRVDDSHGIFGECLSFLIEKTLNWMINWGAWYLTGENLEVVWAKFSTLSWAVLFESNITAWHTHRHI
jgi:hypothetical protein